MNSVQIRILAGPQSGVRLRVDKAEAVFGRDADCDIAINLPFVSRRHGRLVATERGWLLENQSPNGTLVGGRRIGRKPRPVAEGQVVTIGDQDLFEIVSLQASSPESEDTEPAPAPPEVHAARRLTGRTKLWIGLGVYLMVMMLLFVFLSLFGGSDRSGRDPVSNLPPLSESQIRQQVEQEIRRTLPKQPPDSRLARLHADQALSEYDLRHSDPGARYRALVAFREALACTPGTRLATPEDDKRYLDVQEELVEDLTTRYRNAYNTLRNRGFDDADTQFRDLLKIFHAPDTELYRDLHAYWDLTKQQLRESR